MCMRVCVHAHMCTQLQRTFCNPMDYSAPGSSVKSIGEDSHFLLQGIFPIQDQTHVSCTSHTERQIFHMAPPLIIKSRTIEECGAIFILTKLEHNEQYRTT